MTIASLILKRILTPVVGLVLALGLAGTAAVTLAQSGGVQITNITVNSVTDAGAAITFTTSAPAGAKILFGTTTAYGSSSPTIGYTTPEATNHLITLSTLQPSTTYHYQIEVSNASGVSKSADRSFTTRATAPGGAGGPLVLTNIVADCVDTRCQILFTPSKPANVQLVWDTTGHAGFSSYPAGNIVSDPGTTYSASRRALAIPSTGAFQPRTIYYYRLKAVDQQGGSLETNDLQFRTSTNSNDHTFSTGGCTLADGSTIPIGSCGQGGFYCPSGGGAAVQDCTQSCGFTCPASSTCRTNGNCEADPAQTGSPFQCNNITAGPTACYDDNGQFLNPAPAGCYETWGKCNANTILKVRKDRGCNLWLSCATSVQTEAKQGLPAENLCLTLAACNSLNQEGQCNNYLAQGQCDNDPLRFCATDTDCSAGGSCNLPNANEPTQSLKDLTYTTPTEVKQIANLSGNVIAGLDWNQINGTSVIQGNLPWQLMRQIGGDSQIKNGDFEANPPSLFPWEHVPSTTPSENIKVEFEDQDNSINHVLRVSFLTKQEKKTGTCSLSPTTSCTADSPTCGICQIGTCTNSSTKSCSVDSTCATPTPAGTCDLNEIINFAGVASQPFNAEQSEIYYAEVRIRSAAKTPTVRIQFGYAGYTQFTVPDGPDVGSAPDPTYVDVVAKSAWQRVTLGPIAGMSGQTRLAVVCADNATCVDAGVYIDDIQVKPVLQVNTNPSYLTPSCRLYPKSDAPSCDYYDQSGIFYKGWKGYCLENDSVTGTCLSWWPVDVLRGESSIFGSNVQVGYSDRTPLYLCAEAKGVFNSPDPITGTSTFTGRACDAGASSNNICNQPNLNYRAMTSKVLGYRNTAADDSEVEDYGPCLNDQADCRGFYYLFSNVSGSGLTYTTPTGADATLHDYDVDHLRILVQRRTDRFKQISLPTQYVLAPNNPPVTQNGYIIWSASWGLGQDGSCDGVEFQVRWDPNTRLLNSYGFFAQDCTADSTPEGLFAIGLWSLREQCTKLVQVVKPTEVAQVYANRISSSTYRVENLNYARTQDLEPYGGALQPGATNTINPYDPTTWPTSLGVEAPDASGFDQNLAPPYQARAGSPYACVGNCSQICNTQYPGNPIACKSNTECNGLTTTGAAVSPSNYDATTDLAITGKCVGVPGGAVASGKGAQSFNNAHLYTATDPILDKEYFAQERIRRLFVQSLGSWTFENGFYAVLGQGWGPPETLCDIDPTTNLRKREAFPKDFCGIPPSIVPGSVKYLNGESTVATIKGGSGSIGIKFNTDADAEQVPLQGFTIDWGDSSNTYSYPYAPKSDPANPHIFSHVYNNTGPTCGTGQSVNCCTIQNGRKSCLYSIKIQVKDNWGWCNNAVSGSKCPTTMSSANDTGLTVRVQP